MSISNSKIAYLKYIVLTAPSTKTTIIVSNTILPYANNKKIILFSHTAIYSPIPEHLFHKIPIILTTWQQSHIYSRWNACILGLNSTYHAFFTKSPITQSPHYTFHGTKFDRTNIHNCPSRTGLFRQTYPSRLSEISSLCRLVTSCLYYRDTVYKLFHLHFNT